MNQSSRANVASNLVDQAEAHSTADDDQVTRFAPGEALNREPGPIRPPLPHRTFFPERSVSMAQSWRSHRARLAAAHRHYPEADTTDLKVELRAARAEEYIRALVDEAPPLTETQRAKLAALLLPAQRSGHGDAA